MSRVGDFVRRRLGGAVALGMEPYIASFDLERLRVGACLVLRHDLDGLDAAGIERLAEFTETQGIRTTCFALDDQRDGAAAALHLLAAKGGEVHAHTQARALTLEVADVAWLERRYRAGLRRARRGWERAGWRVAGHAPHGVHCYLGIDPDTTWDAIEAATIDSGFAWISGYRAIVKTGEGQAFPPPAAPYIRRRRGATHGVVVFPTAWDDRFLAAGWEARWMNVPAPGVAAAQASLAACLDEARRAAVPCVVSLHPLNWLATEPRYPASLIAWLVGHCRDTGVAIRTLGELAAEVHGARG